MRPSRLKLPIIEGIYMRFIFIIMAICLFYTTSTATAGCPNLYKISFLRQLKEADSRGDVYVYVRLHEGIDTGISMRDASCGENCSEFLGLNVPEIFFRNHLINDYVPKNSFSKTNAVLLKIHLNYGEGPSKTMELNRRMYAASLLEVNPPRCIVRPAHVHRYNDSSEQ